MPSANKHNFTSEFSKSLSRITKVVSPKTIQPVRENENRLWTSELINLVSNVRNGSKLSSFLLQSPKQVYTAIPILLFLVWGETVRGEGGKAKGEEKECVYVCTRERHSVTGLELRSL